MAAADSKARRWPVVALVLPAAALSAAVIDGIVMYAVAQNDPLVALAIARRLPAVVVDQPIDTGLPTVGIDDEAAARAAARLLITHGHTRFAVVAFGLGADERSGPADLARRRNAGYAVSRARLAGYEKALEEAGIAWEDVPVLECVGSVRAAGCAAAERLLADDRPPTAIIATSDILALGVLDAAAAMRRSVPGDLSVVGFDDIPAAAAAGLTTIHQNHHAKGGLAGELLLAAFRREHRASPTPLPAELVVRTSSGPAPY